MDKEDKVKNVIRDTRRKIKYIIWADRELSREEMLDQVRKFNMDPVNIRQKYGTTVELEHSDD